MAKFFIHGAGDVAATDARADTLSLTWPDLVRLSYWTDEGYSASWSSLLAQTASADHNSIFIGESLGGFWAAQLASKYRARCYLLNPAIFPAWQLQQFIGSSLQPSRPAITIETCRSFSAAPDPRTSLSYKRIGLMLGLADTVVDAHITETFYGGYAQTVDSVSDGHAITNPSSFDTIVSRVNAMNDESSLAFAVRRAGVIIDTIEDVF